MTPTQRKTERKAKDNKKQMLQDLFEPLDPAMAEARATHGLLSYMNQTNVPSPHIFSLELTGIRVLSLATIKILTNRTPIEDFCKELKKKKKKSMASTLNTESSHNIV